MGGGRGGGKEMQLCLLRSVAQFIEVAHAHLHMWRPWEDYFIAYLDRTHAFKALYLRTSVKGGAHTCCIEGSHIDATTQCI